MGTPPTMPQRSVAIASSERVEPFRGEDHGGAVNDAEQSADNHASAMVERHLDAEPVSFSRPHTLADEIGVVEDVAVAKGGALRRTGRARGELNVDGIRVLLRCRAGREFDAVAGLGAGGHFIEADEARSIGTDADQPAQRGCASGSELPRRACGDFGHQVAEHGDVVAGPECGGADETGALDFVEGVFEFPDAVAGVDVDQDQPRFRGGELSDHPFGIVGGPDADALAGLQAEGDKTGGEFVDLAAKLSVGPANVLVTDDEGFTLSEAFRCRVEGRADSGLNQRGGGGAPDVAHGDWHGRSSPVTFQEDSILMRTSQSRTERMSP